MDLGLHNATAVNAVENILQDHGAPINPTASFALVCVSLFLLLVLLVVCCQNHWFLIDDMRCGWFNPLHFSFCLFFVALVLFLVYTSSLMHRDSFDYQGLMRVTDITYDIRVESHESCTSSSSGSSNKGDTGTTSQQSCTTTYSSHYGALIQVDWGYDWACPSQPPGWSSHLQGF